MELLTSLLSSFEGRSLFLLLLLEGSVFVANLLLFLLGILERLQSATRLQQGSVGTLRGLSFPP